MNILDVLVQGWELVKFRVTHEDIVNWRELTPYIPDHLRTNCLVTTLAFANLLHIERGQAVSHQVGQLTQADFLLRGTPREVTSDYARDVMYEHYYQTTGRQFNIQHVKFLMEPLILERLQSLKYALAENEGTVISCGLTTATPRHRETAGHTVIIAKGNTGEMVIIDAQRTPLQMIIGDDEVMRYLTAFSNYYLYVKGGEIGDRRESSKTRVNLKHRSKTFVSKAKSAKTQGTQGRGKTRRHKTKARRHKTRKHKY